MNSGICSQTCSETLDTKGENEITKELGEDTTAVDFRCADNEEKRPRVRVLYPTDEFVEQSWLDRILKSRIEALYRRYFLQTLFQQRPLPPSKDGRHIPLERGQTLPLVDERRGQPYISNSIRSSRYTIYDFLPKQLFFQCTRLNNFYFICT